MNPHLKILYPAIMIIGMGQTLVLAIIPMLGRELGLDQLIIYVPFIGDLPLKEFAITLLSSLVSLVFFIVAPMWGRRSDQVGRKKIIITGLIGYCVGSLLFIAVAYLGFKGVLLGLTLYTLLVIARLLMVVVMSAALPASSAYVADVTTLEQRTKGISGISSATQLGVLVGPILAYFSSISFLVPLIIHALLALFAGLLVLFFLPESSPNVEGKQPVKKLSYFDQRYRRYMGIALVMYIMMGMVQQTMAFHFQDLLTLSAVQSARNFSLGMVISSLTVLSTQLLIVRHWRYHPLRLLQIGLPFFIFAYWLFASADSLSDLYMGMFLVGIGVGLSVPGFSSSCSIAVGPQEQGSIAGMNAAMSAMGFVIGPLVGGVLYPISPYYTYLMAAVLMLCLSIFSTFQSPIKAKVK